MAITEAAQSKSGRFLRLSHSFLYLTMFALFTQSDTILPLSQGNCQIQSAKIVEILRGIKDKVNWLAANAEVIKHERLQAKKFKGEYSLHFGAYRVIYSLDRAKRLIIIHRFSD